MNLLKYILIAVYIINCLVVIVLAMMQTKEDAGASATVVGATSSNFFEQNKGRTREGKQKRATIIFGSTFAILTIALSIVYMA